MYLAMKLDTYKVYDRIEWGFLEKKCFWHLAFLKKWTKLIMECIKTVSYLAKLNGQREGHIKPLRAL